MKKKFIVLSHTEKFVQTDDGQTRNPLVFLSFNEGIFDTIEDAEERLTGMVEEERKNNSKMYFSIKEIYVK